MSERSRHRAAPLHRLGATRATPVRHPGRHAGGRQRPSTTTRTSSCRRGCTGTPKVAGSHRGRIAGSCGRYMAVSCCRATSTPGSISRARWSTDIASKSSCLMGAARSWRPTSGLLNADEVVGDARAAGKAPLAQPSGAPAPVARAAARSAPGLWGLILTLLPKCPICGATYPSVTGLAALPYLPQ